MNQPYTAHFFKVMKQTGLYIIFLSFCMSCTESRGIFNAKEMTYDVFEKEITLQAKAIRFDSTVLAPLGVNFIDGYLLFKHSPPISFYYSLYDMQTKEFKGSFLRRGRGHNEFTNLKYWGEITFQDNDIWLYMSDFHKNNILRFNFTEYLRHGITDLKFLDHYEDPHMKNHIINDSTYLAYMFQWDNLNSAMRVFFRKYSTSIKEKEEIDLLKNDITTYEEFDKLGFSELLSPDKKKIAMAMLYMNMIHIFDLDDPKCNITLIPKDKPQPTLSELSQQDNLQSTIYYHGIGITRDYIFALFYDQLLSEFQHVPKQIEIHVFDWNGKPCYKLLINEYLADFCIDPLKKIMYAFDYSENIFQYDLSQIIH